MLTTRTDVPSETKRPTQKTLAATVGSGLGAAISTIFNYLLSQNVRPPPPESVQAAITVVITALVALLLGWITPPGGDERVVQRGAVMRSARVASPRHKAPSGGTVHAS